MAFSPGKGAAIKWPVIVKFLRGDDDGNVVEIPKKFVAHFRPLSEKERLRIARECEAAHQLRIVPVASNDSPRTIALKAAMAAVIEPESAEERDVGLTASLVRDAEYFSRILIGWGRELTDENDSPIPFSASALTELITGADGYQFSVALFVAEGQIRYGNAPEKNLSTSPVPGDGAGEVAPPPSAAAISPTT